MLKYSVVLFMILSIAFPIDAVAQLMMNEVCSSNDMHEDAFGRTPDWIEFVNSGATPIELDDYFLSDDPDDLYKWQLPDEVLQPGDFIVVFSEDEEAQSAYHYNFALSSDGEPLFLMHEDNGLVQSLQVPELRRNHSYGYVTADNAFRFFETLTPGATNNELAYLGYSASPVPSMSPGIYNAPISIQFEAIEGVIYSSAEGYDAIAEMQPIDEEISIAQTTTLRAIAQAENYLPSEPIAATYLISPNHELPILCVGVDPFLFFDETEGIYAMGPDADPEYPFFGANFWEEIELPASLEYFVDGERVVNQVVGVEIHGGKSSRTNPQKPLRFTAKPKYGSAFIEYPVFATKPNQVNFEHWILRNSGADFLHANYRDAFWHELAAAEEFDIERFGFQPAVVYINGAYWGIMNIREKVSPTYFDQSTHHSPDSIIVMEAENEGFIGDSTVFEPLYNFIVEQDLNDPENFEYVASQIDLSSYMDYTILEVFSGNPDWPANNIKYWKPSVTQGKWRYVMYDLDTSLLLYYFLTYDFDIFDWIYGEKSWSVNAKVFINLMENEEFKRQFINRFADYMNTRLQPEKMQAVQDSISDLFASEIEDHFERWGESISVYDEHTTELIPGFFPVRQGFVCEQIINQYNLEETVNLQFEVYPEGAGEIQLNTLRPTLPFEGIYFNGNPIDLTAIPAEGRKFVNWHYSEGAVARGNQENIRENFSASGVVTAIFDDGQTDPIVFFSNPTASFLNGTYLAEGETVLSVYGMDGSKILESVRYHNEGKHLIKLPLEGVSSGVYLFEITSGMGSFTKRFVVQ